MKEQTSYTENLNLGDEFNIRTILDVLKAKWLWFVLSILLFTGGAAIYMLSIPTVYKRKAIVQLKNKVQTQEAFNEKQIIEDSNNNIDGEVLIFKSRLLMGDAIRRLGLEIGYEVDEGLKNRQMYMDKPIKIIFPDSIFTRPASFSIIPQSNSHFRIKGLEDDPDGVMEYAFDAPVVSPIGQMIVSRTSIFSDKWLKVPIHISCHNRESLISAQLGRLEVERSVKDANLLTLTYQDFDPKRGDDILNTLIQVYIDEYMKDKKLVINNTATFIDERLKLINEELSNVETNIEDYRKQNELVNFEVEAHVYVESRDQYDRNLKELSKQKELIQLIQQYLHDPLKEESLLPVNTGIMNVGIEGMIENYNAILMDRNKLKVTGGENNPAIKERNEQLKSLRHSISQSLRNTKDAIEMKLRTASRLQMQAANKLSLVPSQQRYVLSVERQQKIKEELFIYLLNKREENALTLATTESNLRVVDPAYGVGLAGTDNMVILLGALLIGLLIPSLFFYLQPLLDVTVRGRKDIEDNLTIPFLGEIPYRKNKDKLALNKQKRDGVSEAFRIVRSNIDFMLDKKKKSQVLMCTSTNPASGKSFISFNLAVSLALTSKRVILLEMDIRKGSLKSKDGRVQPGITHYLSGKITDLSSLIHSYDGFEELDVITSGPIPPNSAELLLGQALDDMIKQLRERYDYIIVDTVPYGMVADARIISRIADLCIYVIREGLMDRRQLPDIESLYTEGKLPHLSIILNGVRYKHAGYGYGYGYYGYGYGNNYYGYQ